MNTNFHLTALPRCLNGILSHFMGVLLILLPISAYATEDITATSVLSNIERSALVYAEGSGPVNITGSILIKYDGWFPYLRSATISISGGYTPTEDVLRYSGTISSSWDARRGILTLSGFASVSAYQAALRSVQYENTKKTNPSTHTRTVSFMVSDGSDNSNVVSRNIEVTSPNDPPVLSGTESEPLLYCQHSGTATVTKSIAVSDPDNKTLVSAGIQIVKGYNRTEDQLIFKQMLNISGKWDQETGMLTLEGEATLADYQAALRSIAYQNTNPLQAAAGNRLISFVVSDGEDVSNTAYREISVHGRVSVSISGNTSICIDEFTTATIETGFTGTSPWDFSLWKDGQLVRSYNNIAENPFYINVKEEGIYRVGSVSDAYCQGDTVGSGYAHVTAKPSPTAVLSGNVTVCPGQPAKLQVALTGAAPWRIVYLYNGGNATEITGITTSTYELQVTGAGTYTLETVEDVNCRGKVSGSGTVTQHTLPTAVISGDTSICDYTPASLRVNLTGTAPWTIGYRLNAGTPVEVSQITSSPKFLTVYDQGTYTLTIVTDHFCSGTVSGSADVEVMPVPVVSISGLDDAYNKQSVALVPLTGTPAGGTFTGPGVVPNGTGWVFIPALAPIGYNDIVYRYRTSPSACYGYDTARVLILEADAIIFFENNRTRFCHNDKPFQVSATNLAGVTGTFTISGNTGLTDHGDNTATIDPAQLSPNTYTLTYTYLDAGTPLSVEEEFSVGSSLVAAYEWATECFQAGQSIDFVNTSQSPYGQFTDTSFYWELASATETVTYHTQHIQHLFPSPENITVKLAVNNSYGCTDTLIRAFPLRPTISLADTAYFEDFETQPIPWQSENNPAITNNSWELGNPSTHGNPPQGFDGAYSGTNCWFTHITGNTAPQEQSWITSPCFDFTGTQKPMLKAWIWRWFNDARDGVNLQYTTDSGKHWLPLGTLNDGINWYNAYYGNPGAQSVGWTAPKDGGWLEVRHALDECRIHARVQFRLVYSATGTAMYNDGIAFDDLAIMERTRNTLIEHFTNASSLPCTEADSLLDAFTLLNEYNTINLQYHTSQPGADPFYADNEVVPTARQFYYGLSDVPMGMLNGGIHHRFDYLEGSNPFNPGAIITESLHDSKFAMKVQTNLANNQLDTEVEIRALQDLPLAELSVRIVVVERVITGISTENGDTLFRNVVKAMLPGTAGTSVFKPWNNNETMQINQSWDLQHVYNADELRVIAFIQNESSREIYQAAIDSISGLPTSTGKGVFPHNNDHTFSIFPNPAQHELYIGLSQLVSSPVILEIFDNTGKMVCHETVTFHSPVIRIDISNYPQGLYILRLKTDRQSIGSAKVVISK